MKDPNEPKTREADSSSGRRLSMHEGIGDWCDCCPCEAEPRWAEVAEELGIDLGDYEDEARKRPAEKSASEEPQRG